MIKSQKHQDRKNENQDFSIDYFNKHNRFFDLLRTTKKYADLYSSKEALISLLLSVLTVILFMFILEQNKTLSQWTLTSFTFDNFNNTIELIRTLLQIVVPAYLGLTGFIVGGLALISGTLSNKVIQHINDTGKAKSLLRIMFSFYFTGFLYGIVIVVSIFTLLSTYTAFTINPVVFLIWMLAVTYLIYFSIIYSIMLLGTCLRLFLTSFHYYRVDLKKSGNEKNE